MSVDSFIRSKYFINWQASPSAMVNSSWLNSDPLCPLFDAKRFPTILNKHDCAFFAAVVCLLCSCSPSAVARLVISVVINTVYRIVEAWPLAHVITKCLERIQPSFTNRYSAFAIAVKSCCKRAKTSVFHRLPRFVSGRISLAVRRAACPRDINCKASTGAVLLPDDCRSQAVRCGKRAVSACAIAVPYYQVSSVPACERDDRQSSECLASKVENSVVEFRKLKTFAMINLSHDQFLVSEGRLWLEPKRRYSAARLVSLYSRSGEVCNVAC